MKEEFAIRNVVFKALRLSGLPALVREVVQRNKVTIILFHNIDIETADRTFSFLMNHYSVIHLDDFIDAHKKKSGQLLPKKAIIVTFDDGNIGNYELLSTIKKYEIPITIFLCSSIINTNRNFWWRSSDLTLSASEFKQISTEWYNDLRDCGFQIDKEFDKPQALQYEHIEEMKPWVNFQSHTLYHPVLPKCTEDEARKEITESKEMLERDYGIKINAISYPNGDYSERDVMITERAGYRCGITVDFGYNTINTDIFRLKRICLDDNYDTDELIVKVSGVWAFFKSLLEKRRV